LIIVPAVTKLDLPTARPIEAMEELEMSFHIDPDEVLAVSGKTGEGLDELVEAVITRIPPPNGDPEAPLRALIFDSFYDDYRGVVMFVRVVDGSIRAGDEVRMMGAGGRWEVAEVGIFRPAMTSREGLGCGEVGYVIAGVKNLREVRIGDTMTSAQRPAETALTGYIDPKPMVYCGLYPEVSAEFPALRSALEKLSLNDSSFDWEPETSEALGFGFRCGFLGLLHMEIVQERLERENDIAVIKTAPNVSYELVLTSGESLRIDRPGQMPVAGAIEKMLEPWVRLSVIVPTEFLGNLMKLSESRRATCEGTDYLGDRRVMVHFDAPLAEIIYDFFDRMKSITRGYGTMDYELLGYREGDLVKVDVLVNELRVDALSFICHRDEAQSRGRQLVRVLRRNIDRHMFPIPIQAAVGGRIISRETISPIKKNVTAKCYGGDITRKRKLWEKQKQGKKRMKAVGSVQIPQKAFLAVLDGEGEKGA
ncbi:MAG: translation elongation factor 4, partial [Candidatus Brocadiia bacterium]|nr:translation elongation factor 4 [Candidatus Brocadiia bacterium]